MKKVILIVGFCLICPLTMLKAKSTPLPKTIYQAPICAISQKDLTEIKDNLRKEPNKIKAEEIMQKSLSEGKLLSAQDLLKQLKEQIRKDKNNSSPEVIEALNQRIILLENRLTDSLKEKVYVFDNLVRNVTDETLYKNQNYNLEVLRKLCNGGMQNPEHPFEVYEFTTFDKFDD